MFEKLQKDTPFGSNPSIDIVDIDSFYDEDEDKKKDWDNLEYKQYMTLLYYRYLQVIQQGYIPTSALKDEEYKLERPVQDAISGDVATHIKVAPKDFTFSKYVIEVRELLEERKTDILNAFLVGEIPDKSSYQELEGVRRKCIEFCNYFLNMTDMERKEFEDKKINLDSLVV